MLRGMPRSQVRPPNIVIVVADDITPAYFGCYGGRTPTPNIDRMAREGLRFDRSCCTAPLCNPSRYSIFTGSYPGRAASVSGDCGPDEPYMVMQNADLRPGDTSLATILRGAGYLTGHIGKWHSNFAHAQETGRPWRPEGFPDDVSLDDPEFDAALREAHATHVETVCACAGFEWAGAAQWGNLDGKQPERLKHHNVPWFTETALEFLDMAGRGNRPFYLHLANSVPHSPDPARSLGDDRRNTLGGKLNAAPTSHPPDETIVERLREAGIGEDESRVYGINAGVVMIDDQIGALSKKLEAMGELDNTLFLFTADHGIQGKGTCYLGGFHMPTVLRWPAGVDGPGRSVAAPISHVDFVPTLCEATGVSLPSETARDGVSFLPLIRDGRAAPTRETCYHEMGTARGLLRGRWHYIAFRYPESVVREIEATGVAELRDYFAYREKSPFCDFNFRLKPAYFEPDQLYDIEADPFERNNLANDPAHGAILGEMQDLLFSITDRLPGPFPRAVPSLMRSERYRKAVVRRRAAIRLDDKHAPGLDADELFNRNRRLGGGRR